jgi:exodeoxyribonuclease V beta subunit
VKPLEPLDVPLRDTTLIEASAGTGKTWTLATLYLRLLVERELKVGQILVVTYTNAATAELRDRIRSRLREAVAYFEQAGAPGDVAARADDDGTVGPLAHLVARCRGAGTLERVGKHLAAALRGFDEAAIFTIHGFCQRILLENAFESGVLFDAELVTDERPLCSEVVKDFWVKHLHDAPGPLIAHLQKKQSPDQLEKLARKVLASRDMPVLPEGAVALETDSLRESARAWREVAAEAAAAWPGCRDVVAKLLENPLALNQNSYPEEKIAGWCAQLAGFLERSVAGLPAPFEYFDRFTAKKLASCTKRLQRTPQHEFFLLCDRLHAARSALDEACKGYALQLQSALVRDVGPDVRRRHEAANTQSFDDLLYRLRDGLRGDGGGVLARQIRERFHAALIDEFQDTDPVQYDIFRTIYAGSGAPLFLIGDPKQAIYAFRGADVFTYVGAKRDAGDSAHTLQVNHRSAPALVTGVNALFRGARAPFVFAEIPFNDVTPATRAGDALGGAIAARPPLEMLYLAPDAALSRVTKPWLKRQVAAVIAADVVALLASRPTIGDRPLHAGDVAVLCRTNKQAVDVQRALRALGVPSVRQGDDSVFESDEAEEIERVLRAVAEPGDPRLLRAALATRLLGVDAHELCALQHDETRWDQWADRFRTWLELWSQQGFMAAFRRLLETCATERRLLAADDGERRLTNVLHTAELLQAASREAHRGPLALVDWLELMRDDPAARAELASEAAQIRLESDERAVKLVTIHRSKGLEYGVVYCPYTWDGPTLQNDDKQWVRFHDVDDAGTLKLDLGSKEHEAHRDRAEIEAFAENLRLLYVAVTRARHRCVLVWGGEEVADPRAPLGYLLHQDPGARIEDVVERTQRRLKTLPEDARRAELDALVAAAAGSIAVREVTLPAATPAPLAPPVDDAAELVLAQAQRTLDPHWRVSSFSGLAASGGRTSHQAEEGLDHDAARPAEQDAVDGVARTPERVVLHDLPSGARTGEMLHAVLERIDFRRRDPAELGTQVGVALTAYGFEARWESPIAFALDDVLATPIDDGAQRFTLGEVAPSERFNEMQFLFEVRGGFDRERLARCFAQHPSAVRDDDYAERIRRLGFDELRGFLGGFIDLVLVHGGRWYVIDYKSNLLGPSAVSYAAAPLRRAMSQHHYHLQAHLYALAVHRYLTLRLPGYDYARDFGGVAYLFLRGMSPRHAPGCGVHFERPTSALLATLSELVGDAASGGVQ